MKPIFAVLAVLALLLAGCQAYPFAPANPPPPPTCEELAQQEQSPENLPFETIAREYDQGYTQEKPALIILAASDEIPDIEPYISQKAATSLRDVNFNDSLIVAAFSGWKPFAGFAFCITSIQRKSQEIVLHAHLIQQIGSIAAEAASYYHLVQLQKEVLPPGEVTFHLALTRHEYVNPTGRQQVLETSQEEIVTSVTRSLP
ncbi:hypothetical protein D6833_07105 [Candidatus Parcubacteria bacterium]|nr:MAG: hypothetical protein D6833_07105 [Candidatus Parcubacteria bacterium]